MEACLQVQGSTELAVTVQSSSWAQPGTGTAASPDEPMQAGWGAAVQAASICATLHHENNTLLQPSNTGPPLAWRRVST